MATVTAQLAEGTVVDIQARQFSWKGDEPISLGGTDTGATPYELLLGGLAACIAVTLRLYANHKGIALRGIDVRLEFGLRDIDEFDNEGSGIRTYAGLFTLGIDFPIAH